MNKNYPIHNLPSKPYTRLIGRSDEVEGLYRTLKEPGQDSSQNTVLIDGPSGVGKTSLALEVGHLFCERYQSLSSEERFSAIIWISAQPTILNADGFTDTAFPSRTLSEVINSIAIVLDQRDILRALPENQVSLTLKALSESRNLIIVDNLETVVDERVFGFLHQISSSTRILLTSRLKRDVGKIMTLAPLEQTSSIALIQELSTSKDVKLNDSETVDLFRLTGGIPFGIVLTMSLMQYFQPNDIIKSLTDIHSASFAKMHSDLFQFLFGRAWEKIEHTPSAGILFSLTFFANGATKDAIGYISRLDEDALLRDQAVRELLRLSLIQKREDRYEILPMTKSFVSTVFSKEGDQRMGYRKRWVEHLFNYIRECYRFPTWQDVFSEIDKEYENLLELFKWVEVSDDEYVIELASVIFHDITYYLYSRGYWSILLRHKDWVSRSLLNQDLIEEYLVVWLTWPLRIYISQKAGNEVITDCIGSAEKTLSSLNESDALYSAIIDFNKASVLRRNDRQNEALQKLKNSVVVFREQDAKRWESEAVQRLGNTYAKMQEYDLSQEAYMRSAEIAQSVAPSPWTHEMIGLSKGNLGILANRLGKYTLARNSLMECEPFIAQATDRSVVYIELAIANYYKARLREALHWAEKSSALSDEIGLMPPVAESDEQWELEILPTLRSVKGLIGWEILARLKIIDLTKLGDKNAKR